MTPGIISCGDPKRRRKYSLTCYEEIESEGYGKGRISVGMGLIEAEIRYGKRERYREGGRESSRNGKKKSLNCTTIGWNTLILSFTPFRNIRYYRQIDKVRILKAL